MYVHHDGVTRLPTEMITKIDYKNKIFLSLFQYLTEPLMSEFVSNDGHSVPKIKKIIFFQIHQNFGVEISHICFCGKR